MLKEIFNSLSSDKRKISAENVRTESASATRLHQPQPMPNEAKIESNPNLLDLYSRCGKLEGQVETMNDTVNALNTKYEDLSKTLFRFNIAKVISIILAALGIWIALTKFVFTDYKEVTENLKEVAAIYNQQITDNSKTPENVTTSKDSNVLSISAEEEQSLKVDQ